MNSTSPGCRGHVDQGVAELLANAAGEEEEGTPGTVATNAGETVIEIEDETPDTDYDSDPGIDPQELVRPTGRYSQSSSSSSSSSSDSEIDLNQLDYITRKTPTNDDDDDDDNTSDDSEEISLKCLDLQTFPTSKGSRKDAKVLKCEEHRPHAQLRRPPSKVKGSEVVMLPSSLPKTNSWLQRDYEAGEYSDSPNESSSLLANEKSKDFSLAPGINGGGECTNCQKKQDVQIHIGTVDGSVNITHVHNYPDQDTDPRFPRSLKSQKTIRSSGPSRFPRSKPSPQVQIDNEKDKDVCCRCMCLGLHCMCTGLQDCERCCLERLRWVVVRSRQVDRQLIRLNFPWVAYFVDGALSCVTYAGNTFVIEPVVWTAENAKQGAELSILFAQRRVEAARTFSPRRYALQTLEAIRSQDPRVAAGTLFKNAKGSAGRRFKRWKLIFWKVWTTSVFYKCIGWQVQAPPIASDTNAQHV